jgi:hypothetical protein
MIYPFLSELSIPRRRGEGPGSVPSPENCAGRRSIQFEDKSQPVVDGDKFLVGDTSDEFVEPFGCNGGGFLDQNLVCSSSIVIRVDEVARRQRGLDEWRLMQSIRRPSARRALAQSSDAPV